MGLPAFTSARSPDERQASSTLIWICPGEWTVSFEIGTLDGLILSRCCANPSSFTSEYSEWGFEGVLTRDELISRSVTDPDSLVVYVSISGPTQRDPRQLHPQDTGPLMLFFRSPQYSNVAFRFQTPGDTSAYYLYATEVVLRACSHFCRLFNAGFRETSPAAKIKLNPKKLDRSEPTREFCNDANKFAVFDALFSSSIPPNNDKTNAAAASESSTDPSLVPNSQQPLVQLVPLEPQQPQQPDLPPFKPVEQDGEPAAKKRRIAEEEEEEQRSFTLIEVTDCSWETFRAFLKFLHGGNVHFSPPRSDYLVARQVFLATSSETEPKPDPLDPFELWLKYKNPGMWTYVCWPHTLYRLADKYLVNELRDLARDFILRSLTVENAAYKAFCQLSLDFPDDFQNPVLAFMVENWDNVKSSVAMKHAILLLEAGDLPGGGEVFSKLLEGLSGGKKDEKDKEKEKEGGT